MFVRILTLLYSAALCIYVKTWMCFRADGRRALPVARGDPQSCHGHFLASCLIASNSNSIRTLLSTTNEPLSNT